MKRYFWKISNDAGRGKSIAEAFNLNPILADIISKRGINLNQCRAFINPELNFLHSADLLPDMKKAKNRIQKAAIGREKIMVFGDYDVDGIVSLAVFNEFAKKFPNQFIFYIPHRVKEGYGLSQKAIAKAKKNKVSLIVTFDCGINSCQEVDYAKSLGIDVVIVDHHLPQKQLPKAAAVVNPKKKGSKYPFLDLTAGALAFKLLQVLENNDCYQVLDLVALSIVCDVAPLLGENRILLKQGIEVLKKSQRASVRALCAASKVRQENITSFHVGYILGPRVNASGRIAHAQDSLRLFLTDNYQEALSIAVKLNQYNQLRKNVEKQILKEAEFKIENDLCGEHALVVGSAGWHPGVLGIVASRLKDKYCRPSFVVSFDKGVGRGSGRSTEEVHLIEMLDKCSDFLRAYGGHRKAAGMELEEENLTIFRDNINLAIEESRDKYALPQLEIDAKLGFDSINIDFYNQLNLLSPYGEANPKPLFLATNLTKKKEVEKVKSWYSVWLTDENKVFEAFTYSKDLAEIIKYADNLDIVFSLEKDNYHNQPRLFLRDCRLS